MSCYNKIKKSLEKGSGVKVVKLQDNKITISRDNKLLTTYDLKFVEYGNNLKGFLDYWETKLKTPKKKEKKKMTTKVHIVMSVGKKKRKDLELINMFLKDLVEKNGDKIVRYDNCRADKKYMSVFNYSAKYGGTFDSFKYYNDYVIELGEKNK